MSFDLKLGLRRTLIWCARSEAGMRSSTIVMAGPGFKRLSDVGFVEWNHKIETFSTCTADQALAKCIRLGRLIRRLQHSQPKRLQRLIQVLRIDTVTIMDNESVSFVTANAFSELLKRPRGRRMLSDVKVKDAPRIEFHDHEHVDQPERCCHNDKEVGGDDGLRVIAHESHPALGRVRRAPRGLRNIASNRPRRNLNSDFQQEFVGDAFLTPCGIVRRHFNNQLLQVGRHTWTATGSNTRNPVQCQRISVSGWTTVRVFRQSKKRERWASVKRMELVQSRGLIFR